MAGRLRGAYFTVWSLCSLTGGIVALLLVRGFFFSDTDEMWWIQFWGWAFHEGGLNTDAFLRSATFAKLVAGFIVGGLLIGGPLFFVACLIWD